MHDRVGEGAGRVNEGKHRELAATNLIPGGEADDGRRQQRRHVPVNQVQHQQVEPHRLPVAADSGQPVGLNRRRDAKRRGDAKQHGKRNPATEDHLSTIDISSPHGQAP